MGWRGTVVLAVLIAAVGAYVWFEAGPPEQPLLPADTLLGEPRMVDPNQVIRHLLDFEPADVTGVRLERDGVVRASERANDTWTATSNPGAVNDFLQNLAQLAVVMDIPAGPTELQEYGLQPPHSVVRLQTREPQPLVLLIGDRNPSVTGAYARIGEQGPVVLAGALVLWEFDKAFRALGPPGE